MTSASAIALFTTLFVLALLPGVSTLTVTARTVSFGFYHGILVSLGIVLADTLFILLVIFGLAWLAQTLNQLFTLIKIVGAAYLIILGFFLWHRHKPETPVDMPEDASTLGSFSCGFLITLGDQKAILFYSGLLPAFIDMAAVTSDELIIVLLSMTIAVLSARLIYAAIAVQGRHHLQGHSLRLLQRFSALMMIAIGIFVLTISVVSLISG